MNNIRLHRFFDVNYLQIPMTFRYEMYDIFFFKFLYEMFDTWNFGILFDFRFVTNIDVGYQNSEIARLSCICQQSDVTCVSRHRLFLADCRQIHSKWRISIISDNIFFLYLVLPPFFLMLKNSKILLLFNRFEFNIGFSATNSTSLPHGFL